MMQYNKKELDVVQGMPVALAARLEFASAPELFQLALQHNLQYKVLIDSAWDRDIVPVLDWFKEQKQYDEAIHWLYDNTPDVFRRTLAINALINKKNEEEIVP